MLVLVGTGSAPTQDVLDGWRLVGVGSCEDGK
jgi:hypothetical protein